MSLLDLACFGFSLLDPPASREEGNTLSYSPRYGKHIALNCHGLNVSLPGWLSQG